MRTQTTAKMFGAVRILILVVLIASTANSQPQETRNLLKCEQSSSCTCIEYNEVEIQCPKFEPHVFVRIQSNNYVHFECENMTGNEYELVPKYQLDVAAFLQITKCSLLQGTSIISSYLKNIQIDRIRSFQFVSSGANKNTRIESKHFRGLEGIERFDLRGLENEIRELPEDLFVGMEKLSWVRIRVANIILPAELFTPLENLEFLELGHNKLQSLEPGFLKNQKKLQQLNLWGNALRNLNKESFRGLDLVKELDLSANGMESLEPDLLFHLTNLTDINLSANKFSMLPEGLFANNRKLKHLRLMDNHVTMETLPSDFLSNLTEIEKVAIKCDLKKLPEGIFAESRQIKELFLAQNSLDDLPEFLLKDQENLVTLDLADNLISQLPKQFFAGTKSLETLKLDRNRLVAISTPLFASLSKLTTLLLNNNQLANIEGNALSALKSVKTILLQNNKLTFNNQISFNGTILDVPAGSPFQMLDKLVTLNLANNSFTSVFEDFTLGSLQNLNLSHNLIESIKTSDLETLAKKPITIDLTYNSIEEIIYQSFTEQLPDARVILNHNPIACDCRLLEFVKYLKIRNHDETVKNPNLVTSELICAEPAHLASKHVTSLDPLDLECLLDDPLTTKKFCPSECECKTRPFDRLLRINCNASMNNELPIASDMSLNETELTLENRNLTEIPFELSPGYKQVTKLLLSDNQITEIKLENLPPKLKILKLNNNELESLNSSVMSFLRNTSTLEELTLSGNPWLCDCAHRELMIFVQTMSAKISDYASVKCKDDRPFNTVNTADLCNEEVNLFVMIICIITAIMSLILGGLAALYYKYQKQIKMWLYSHNMCLWFVTEEELDKDKRYDAFVSYSHRDQDFVADYLLPELENGTIPYKLCVHERDWSPGLEISTQISNSVNDAKRTIIVMSPNYLQSNWAQWEFRVAQSHAATEKRSRIIVILYGDIGDINKLEPDIRDYLKLNTYVKWGDKWFWEKLKYAMPHVKSSERVEKTKGGLMKTGIKSSVDDKLELIKPISVTPPQLTTPPAEKVANPLITSLNAKNANQNGKVHNGSYNGHVNGAFVINTSSRQSDV